MTTKEALEYAKSIQYCNGCRPETYTLEYACKNCEHKEFFQKIIEILENQIKIEDQAQRLMENEVFKKLMKKYGGRK